MGQVANPLGQRYLTALLVVLAASLVPGLVHAAAPETAVQGDGLGTTTKGTLEALTPEAEREVAALRSQISGLKAKVEDAKVSPDYKELSPAKQVATSP
mmetsp:Transcript_18869/g.57018  ORF Transcript_18869/g.57018 Transcript_18869/m.57018 type:complete len:99 (+) Transcript_18869:409-705(+)